jgi:hypothetical protein
MTEPTALEPTDPTGYPGWDEMIARHPDATVFHTAAWAKVLSGSYRYRPVYFASVEGMRLSALLPFMEIRSFLTGVRGVSLPFTDECAPILPNGTDFEKALRPVIDMAKAGGWKTLEVRGTARGGWRVPAAVEYLTHTLDLAEGEEALSAAYSQNLRRNLRKAEKEGVAVEAGASPRAVQEFYRLNCLTRREHGLPPQPFRFFELLREHVLEKGFGTLLLARHKGEVVSGDVFLHCAGKAIYKYGASDPSALHLRANHLVFREGIRTMIEKGCRTLSFGRTDIEHEGLRRFKIGWGAKETRLQYARFDMKTGDWLFRRNTSSSPWEGIFSRMPLPMLRLVGNIAYRHVG